MGYYLTHSTSFHQVSWKPLQLFSCYLAHKDGGEKVATWSLVEISAMIRHGLRALLTKARLSKGGDWINLMSLSTIAWPTNVWLQDLRVAIRGGRKKEVDAALFLLDRLLTEWVQCLTEPVGVLALGNRAVMSTVLVSFSASTVVKASVVTVSCYYHCLHLIVSCSFWLSTMWRPKKDIVTNAVGLFGLMHNSTCFVG